MFTLIEWSLMKSPYFLITMVGSSCSFSAILNYFLLLPLLCKEFGLSEDKTSILLSATNASDVLFRLAFAWAGDWKCSKELFCGKPRRILYAISVFGLSIFMIGAFNVLLRRSLFSKNPINDMYLKTIVLTKLYIFRHYICKHFPKLIVLLYSIWNICERNTWERAISVHRIIWRCCIGYGISKYWKVYNLIFNGTFNRYDFCYSSMFIRPVMYNILFYSRSF